MCGVRGEGVVKGVLVCVCVLTCVCVCVRVVVLDCFIAHHFDHFLIADQHDRSDWHLMHMRNP